MAISPYLRSLRAVVGRDLLLLPGVTVLPWDDAGRLLLVRNIETGDWQTIGGLIEPDERPRDAAVRETLEEAGVEVELTGLRDVVGGPDYRFVYPNGDQVAYVGAIFDARVIAGEPRGDGDETSEARWVAPGEFDRLAMDGFTRTLLADVGATA
jgi:8-oxo-dGTP pyrophosphatase MutT (NUDIX family)